MAIPENHFGDSGISLPRIGLGLAALGRPGYINLGHAEDLARNYVMDAMEGRTHRMLDLAFAEGIRYFDMARSYGRAEDFFHSWLQSKQLPPEAVYAGSKWGYTYTAGWQVEADKHEVKEHTLENLNKQWEASQRLLPHLRLYQIHSATFDSGVLDRTPVLNRLVELKQKGILIGLTLSGAQQAAVLHTAMEKTVDGTRVFDAVQATYNILETSCGPALAEAAEAGLGIIVKEVFANGRLTSRNNHPEFVPRKEQLQDIGAPFHADIDAVALAFVLAQPWAHLALSGAAAEPHLKSNLRALNVQLDADALTIIEGMYEPSADYWAKRSQLNWN